nr:hypothetical protein [uncultured Desulfobacter sp.]
MRISVSASSVRSFLKNRTQSEPSLTKYLESDSSILKDVGQLTGFVGSVLSGNPLSVAEALANIFGTAGSFLSLCTQTIKKFENNTPELQDLFKYEYEKFEIFYFVLCQRSYFYAIDKNVSKYNSMEKIEPKKLTDDQKQNLKNFIQKIDFEEVRYFLSVDPVTIENPIYKIYSQWLKKMFSLYGYEKIEYTNIIESIDKEAFHHFRLKISEDTPLNNWIRSYLLLDHQVNSADIILDHLSGIKHYLSNWIYEKRV